MTDVNSPGMIKKYGKMMFCSENSTEFNQLVFSFALGLLFGPMSWGIIYYVIFIIIYEIIVFYVTSGLEPFWRLISRISINSAALIGWMLGRWLVLGRTGFEWCVRHY